MAGKITIGEMLVAIFIIAAVFGVFLWHAISGSNEVRPQVGAFCAQVQVGAPVVGLEDSARAKGLTLLAAPSKNGQHEHPRPDAIAVYKTYALSRAWRCDIEHEGGKVISKRFYDWSWD